MKKLLFSCSLLTLILISSIYYFVQNKTFEKPVYSTLKDNTKVVEKSSNQTLDTIASSATLSAIGDVLIHDKVYNLAQTKNKKYEFAPMFKSVQTYLSESDITVANQESIIGGEEIGLSAYPSFNSPYEVGDALKENGIDLVTLANNHTLDRGEKAIQSAISHWNEIDMPYTGSYVSAKDKTEIRTIKKNGIVFSFLAYTYGTNGISVPKDKPYLVNLINWQQIEQDISRAKELSDVVVVSLHFGQEYQRLPNEEQKELAHKTANAGADIIIGHHPHVLQPMEWIQREDGERSFVVYSLGNFLSAQKSDYKDIGGIMQIKVEKVTSDSKTMIKLKDPAFIPTFVDERYNVRPLKQVAGKKAVYDEINNHMSQWIPNLKVSFQ